MKSGFLPLQQKRIGERIANEILMHLRSRKKCSREISLYEPVGTDKEGNEVSLLDICEADQEDIADSFQTGEEIKQLMQLLGTVLDPREEEIIRLRYGIRTGREMTQRQIGEKLSLSRSYISRIEKKALEKLRRAMESK